MVFISFHIFIRCVVFFIFQYSMALSIHRTFIFLMCVKLPIHFFQFILSVLSNVYCTLFSNNHLKPFWQYYILAASGSKYLISLHTVYFAKRFQRKIKQNFANIQHFVRTINDSWSQYMGEKKKSTRIEFAH